MKHEYLASSHTDVLIKIAEWIEDPAADKQVFWLHGAAGMGKSTIAIHTMKVLQEAGRLAGHFFFDRNDKKQEDPGFIIGTLAYQLALLDQNMRAVVCEAIQFPSSEQQFLSQFKAHVLNALLVGSFSLPMVIILDALDEYKDILDFLNVLIKLVPSFPPHIKLFLTSRPDKQFKGPMAELKAEEWELGSATHHVMEHFFQKRLGAINQSEWQNGPPSPDQISRLIDIADGLFVWAATACNAVDPVITVYFLPAIAGNA
jgi:NACHT domain